MNHPAQTSHHAAIGVVDYIVVVSSEDDYHASYHHFSEKVNRKLKAGYQLHGPPFTVKQSLCQAMIRHTGATHGGDTAMFQKAHAPHP